MPRKRLRAWSLKKASDEVPPPSFGKNTWPMASRSPTRCSGLVRTAVSGFQRWLRAFVEGREGVHRLPVLGAVAGRDVVVLALDVEHDDRVGPVQQVRDDDADALAAAGRRRQHHRELAGQGEEPAPVAADQDARAGGLASIGLEQAGARALRPGSQSGRRRAAGGAAARPRSAHRAGRPTSRNRTRPSSR